MIVEPPFQSGFSAGTTSLDSAYILRKSADLHYTQQIAIVGVDVIVLQEDRRLLDHSLRR
eukprot:4745891-Heterocapsa_arctica.AAC.1